MRFPISFEIALSPPTVRFSPTGRLYFAPGGLYLVQGRLDDVILATTIKTAQETFARAIEWQVAERFSDVTISYGNNTYSIDEFASVMARFEISKTVEKGE